MNVEKIYICIVDVIGIFRKLLAGAASKKDLRVGQAVLAGGSFPNLDGP